MKTKYTAAEREEARAALLEILKPGSRVYTVCHHVARSGMMRAILRQAEKFQDQLYAKWERVELVRAPIFGEQGAYVFEVANK